jgi:hypothetical protein
LNFDTVSGFHFFDREKSSMIKQLKPWALALCLLNILSTPVQAETTESQTATANTDLHETMTSAHAQEKSVHLLKHHSYHIASKKHKPAANNTSAETNVIPNQSMESVNVTGPAPAASQRQALYINGPQSFPMDIDVPGQSFVSTGPYIGIPLLYSGMNLIINSPNINEDVTLLNMRKAIRERLVAMGRPIEEDHAHLLLSGIVEGQAFYQAPGQGADTSGIDVSTAALDGYILGPSPWTSALLSFAYDNNVGTSEGSLNNNARALNSRVFISKAFIVIGNYQESPFYGTLGQMYVPFGTYSTNMISNPLTKILGRMKERALLIGYQQQGKNALYGSTYIFNGDTHVGSASRLNNGGINLGYRYAYGRYSGDFGGGLIANLADSIGMQVNGYSPPNFGGFGANNGYGNERIAHRVAAFDLRGVFSIGESIDLLAEYVSAFGSFSENDLTFNTHGARPQALNLEAAYTFPVYEKPTTVALGYGRSKDALALGLAAQRYSMVINTSIWKDTLQSLEFRKDMNYAESDYATGTGSAVMTPITGMGKPDYIVTAQFDIYF